VVTRNGVVTVTGTAKTAAEKRLVEKIIRNIDGVLQVRNRIKVE
jgi:osmotically-inducible protein OsmY